MGEIATQLTGVAPNHPALEPYFALAEERDLPLLIHTLGIGPYLPGFRSAIGSPFLLEEVLVRHPKQAIEQAPFLTEEQKRDILYHNAVRFLRLEQDASSG